MLSLALRCHLDDAPVFGLNRLNISGVVSKRRCAVAGPSAQRVAFSTPSSAVISDAR